MTWVTNKTWVDGDTPSADDFNTFIRDQLAHIDQHKHDGLPGSGSATLDDVDYVDFDDQASGLGAAESGQTRMWSESDGIHVHPNGGSEVVLENTDHSHAVTHAETDMDGAKGAHVTARSTTQFDADSLVGDIYNGVGSRSYTVATVDDVYAAGNPMLICAAAGYIFDVTATGSNAATVDPTFKIVVEGSMIVQDVYTNPGVGTEYSGALVDAQEIAAGTITLALIVSDTDGSYTGGGGTNNAFEGYFHGTVDGQQVLLDYA